MPPSVYSPVTTKKKPAITAIIPARPYKRPVKNAAAPKITIIAIRMTRLGPVPSRVSIVPCAAGRTFAIITLPNVVDPYDGPARFLHKKVLRNSRCERDIYRTLKGCFEIMTASSLRFDLEQTIAQDTVGELTQAFPMASFWYHASVSGRSLRTKDYPIFLPWLMLRRVCFDPG